MKQRGNDRYCHLFSTTVLEILSSKLWARQADRQVHTATSSLARVDKNRAALWNDKIFASSIAVRWK